jgi:glucan phosphoethanolaminetransferase (alkaline phosphatase superfamily)
MTSLGLSRPTRVPQHSPATVMTALSVAVFGLTVVWAMVDARVVDDTQVWVKPMKFALSFIVYFGTFTLVHERLSAPWRNGWILAVVGAATSAAMVFELGYMIIMAAQQQASHFNESTPFTLLMYNLMGQGALILVLGVLVYGIVALRDRNAALSPALRWGIGWGFILSFVLTLMTAGAMASMGRHVGIAEQGAATIPLFGWSATVGDLRPAHFLALHGMQALPLAGLWFDRRGMAAGPAISRMRLVALVYVAITLAVFAQGLMELPFVRP